MTRIPARPEGYGYEYVPAMDSPRGKTEPNWRVSDPFDNRIATCYDEAGCRLIVDALNGAPIASDPGALEVIRESARRVKAAASYPSTSSSTGATLNLAAVSIMAACDAIQRGGGTVELAREGSIDADPYARGGFSFADLVEYSRQEITFHDAATGIMRRVRDLILDDVHAAHRMLDALGIAGGPLTARIGLALGWKVLEREARAQSTRKAPAAPLADADSVKVPEPDDVFAVLNNLTGEEAFKLFDHAGVLPDDADVVKGWNLMDETDVGTMIHDCLAIALNTERLAVVYKAAREAVARKVAK